MSDLIWIHTIQHSAGNPTIVFKLADGKKHTKLLNMKLCILGNFSYFLPSAAICQHDFFFQNTLSGITYSVKQLESRSGPTECWA